MAEILIDISGRAGLAEGFAGDSDMLTPQPQNLLGTTDGEFAGGLFNPYLRSGYLAPTITTTTAITLGSTPDSELTSVVHDKVNDQVFFADRGSHIYKGTSLVDTALEEILDLGSGEITDLEIYTINQSPKLFFTSFATEMTMSVGALTDSLRSDWENVAARVDSSGVTKPTVIVSGDHYSTGTSHSFDLTLPSATDMVGVVAISSRGSVSAVTFGGVAMTQIASNEITKSKADNYTYLYTITGLNSGSNTVSVTTTSAATMVEAAVLDYGHQTTPVSESNITYGVSGEAVNSIAVSDNCTYLQFVFALKSYNDISSAGSLWKSFDETTETSDSGSGLFFNPDGTKMYLTGRPATTTYIYQYTLSTAWDVSTATYDTKSLNVESYGGEFCQIFISNDGLNVFTKGEGASSIHKFTLSTAWDISTGSYDSTLSLSTLHDASISFKGFTFSSSGGELYVYGSVSMYDPEYNIFQYSLSTAWDLSTASLSNSLEVSREYGSLHLSHNDTVLLAADYGSVTNYLYEMSAIYPLDISKAQAASGESWSGENGAYQVVLSDIGGHIINRDSSTHNVQAYQLSVSGAPTLTRKNGATEIISQSGLTFSRMLVEEQPGRTVEVGEVSLTSGSDVNPTWLSTTQGVEIKTRYKDIFMVSGDNGFLYLFTGNAVHKIDGDISGGSDGSIAKNVLKFPPVFSITDAFDYRSKMYIALHRYIIDADSTNLSNYTGKTGVLVWNKSSVQLGATSFIEIPGVREIKKIYASTDGLLKLITISDAGLTELRSFAYNDSGSVVFPVVKTLGIGAYPKRRDGLTTAGDKVVWLAQNGYVYAEKQNTVTILFQAKAPGATTALMANNITSGIVFFGSDSETASSGYRSNKQAIVLSYTDGGTKYHKKFYPFDLTDGSNGAQTPLAGSVYTTVKYLPITSRIRRLRIYNKPVSSTGTDVIATVKVYFNQSTDPTMPNGMTKSITLDEAKRGYVDFNISKAYVHAVQIEIEWASGTPIGDDMYMPSIALIQTEDTEVKTPDGE